MSESIQNDTISETVREFVQYYENEIGKNVNHIYELIEQLKTDSTNYPLLAEIESSAQAISDLAMVYGFEGVEVIASRMKEAIKQHSQQDISPEFLAKLQESARAIAEAMCLIDERKERELIRQWSQDTFHEEKLITEDIEDSESSNPEQDEELVFDIKEDEKLISLLSDEDGADYEIGNLLLSIDNNGNDEGGIDSAEVDNAMPQPEELASELVVNEEQNETKIEKTSAAPLENDILVLDFQRTEAKKEKKKGFLGKIAHLFGSKSRRDKANVPEDILVEKS
ncbi:hypothetical protein DRQ15_01980 [candidate division KSB1 bacterium]|nr:MAG: hypothetical protein DRQ15_01980 [candidate division KSB1 bacterium]